MSKKETNNQEEELQSVKNLKEIDKYMNQTYDDVLEEIQDMQTLLATEDLRITKKARKAAKKGKFYDANKERKAVRERVIDQIETTNWIDRITNLLRDIVPIITIIARLVASLILSILNLDCVKTNINKETLQKLNVVYSNAMLIGA